MFFSPVKRRRSYLLGVGQWPAKTSVSAQGPASKRGSSKIPGPSLFPQVGFTLPQGCLDQIGFLFLTLGSLCWHLALSVNLKLSMQFVFMICLCASLCSPGLPALSTSDLGVRTALRPGLGTASPPSLQVERHSKS